MRIVSGTTGEKVHFVAVSTADHFTRVTGLTSFNTFLSVAGSTGTAGATTMLEVNSTQMTGVYAYTITDSTVFTLGAGIDSREVCLHITSSMDPVTRTFEVYRRTYTTGATLSATMMSSINAKVTSVDSRLSSMDTMLSSVNAHVTSADTVANSVLTKVTSIDSRLSSMDTMLSSVNAKVTSIDSRLTSMDTMLTSVNAHVTSADTVANSVLTKVTSIDSRLSSMDTMLSSVNAKVTSVDSRLSSMDTMLSSVNAKVTSIDTKVMTTSSVKYAELADMFLDRNMATGVDSGSSVVRTPRQALRFLRNKWDISGTTLSIYAEDDATPSWTAVVTTASTADPISGVDPNG